jgi:hypothetical protein
MPGGSPAAVSWFVSTSTRVRSALASNRPEGSDVSALFCMAMDVRRGSAAKSAAGMRAEVRPALEISMDVVQGQQRAQVTGVTAVLQQ